MNEIPGSAYSFIDELKSKSKEVLLLSFLYPILVVLGFSFIIVYVNTILPQTSYSSFHEFVKISISVFFYSLMIILPAAFFSALSYILICNSLSRSYSHNSIVSILENGNGRLILDFLLIVGILIGLFSFHLIPNEYKDRIVKLESETTSFPENINIVGVPLIIILAIYYIVPTCFLSYYAYRKPNDFADIVLGGREINTNEEKEKLVYEAFDNMRVAFGFSKSQVKLKVIPWQTINSLVVSSSSSSTVYITLEAVYSLDYHELEAIFAHEFSHIKNRDSYYFTSISIVAQTSILIGWMFKDVFASAFLEGRNKNFIVALLYYILGVTLILTSPIFFNKLISRFSKIREKLADTTAVLTTKYPPAFISLLVKAGKEDTSKFIKKKKLPVNLQALLFDYESETHPRIWERIEYICNLTKTPLPEEYVKLKEINI